MKPGPEPRGEHVVGLAGGRAGLVVAGVGQAEAQREVGHGQQAEQRRGGDQQHDGAARHKARPARPEAEAVAVAGAMVVEVPALFAAQDAHAHEAEQGRQQGDGGGHRDEDGHGRRETQAVQEPHAQHEQAEQGDAHRAAGKQHGATGRVQGAHRGVFGRQAGLQALPVARDDEERVVDADTQADESGQRGGEGHRRHVAERPISIAVPTATIAVMSGSAIPSSDPKATNKITAAAATPIIDALDSGCCSLFSMARPPSCTVSPRALAASAMLITRLTSALLRLPACWVKSTVANAVRPSRLIDAAPLLAVPAARYGLTTAATSGTRDTRAASRKSARRRPGP